MTFCTYQRQPLFIDRPFTEMAIDQMLTSSARNAFAVYAYCFMPDHVHLLVEGRAETARLGKYAKDVKQRIAFHDPLERSGQIWQLGLYDRILRQQEPLIVVARYILENPVRKGPVEEPRDYPYSGSTQWTWEQMLEMWQTDPEAVRVQT